MSAWWHAVQTRMFVWAGCGVAGAFALARFLRLDADFPLGINWSGDLFTDEGWYSNATVHDIVRGHWYVPGDLNHAVLYPIGFLLQRLMLGLLGRSLSSARVTSGCCVIAVTVLAGLIVKRGFGSRAAIPTMLLIVSNFLFFAYSRLAFLEMPMIAFEVSAVWVVLGRWRLGAIFSIAIAAALAALSVLTKTTGVVALLLVTVAAWLRGDVLRERAGYALLAGGLGFAIVFVYCLIAWRSYPHDFVYVAGASVLSEWIRLTVRDITSNLVDLSVRVASAIGWSVSAVAVASVSAAVAVSRRYRQDLLVRVCLVWIAAQFVMLGSKDYSPPRYFLPFMVPIAMLIGTALAELADRWRSDLGRAGLVLLTAALVTLQGRHIVSYLRHPSFSFVTMARDVARIVGDGHETNRAIVGTVADSVALETGLSAIGSTYGTASLDWRLSTYRPGYYVAFADQASLPVLEKRATLVELKAWKVFDNYYDKQPVRLYRLDYHDAEFR